MTPSEPRMSGQLCWISPGSRSPSGIGGRCDEVRRVIDPADLKLRLEKLTAGIEEAVAGPAAPPAR